MAGNHEGGLKAAATNKAEDGDDFYQRMGRRGGLVSRGGGFTDREFASAMGKKGGKVGKRGRASRRRYE